MPLNLSSIKGSAQAAHQLREKVKSIDILVANAGVGGGYAMTDDGFEWSFGVNHLGMTNPWYNYSTDIAKQDIMHSSSLF